MTIVYTMVEMDSNRILHLPRLISQDGNETSIPDRTLRLLARMIARELIRRRDGDRTHSEADDLQEAKERDESVP